MALSQITFEFENGSPNKNEEENSQTANLTSTGAQSFKEGELRSQLKEQ